RRDDIIGQEGNITIRYPQAGELGFTIKKRDLLYHNVQVLKEVGSEDDKERWTSWQGDFQRTSPQNSVLHVKIYTTKSNLHSEEIKVKQLELDKLTVELEETRKFRDSHALQKESKKQKIKEIVSNHREGIQILGFVANEVLAPNVFNALMEAEAYIGDTAVCAKKVEKVYMELAKQDMELAKQESTASPDSPKKGAGGKLVPIPPRERFSVRGWVRASGRG
ncbi:hypothetical protein BGZ74_009744, partial [Mortierella antarctica]